MTLFERHRPDFALLAVLFILLVCRLFCSCTKMPIHSSTVDSLRVDHRVEYRETVRLVQLEAPLPKQSAETTTADSASHLETDLATSDARINPDGTLYHSIENKTGSLKVEAPVVDTHKLEQKDSIVYHKSVEEVPVRMPLRWWQSALCWIGSMAIGAALFTLLTMIKRRL